MSVHSVQHHTNKLKEIGFIRHVGLTKAGRWEVVEDHMGASGDERSWGRHTLALMKDLLTGKKRVLSLLETEGLES